MENNEPVQTSLLPDLVSAYLLPTMPDGDSPSEYIRDNQWVRQAFVIPQDGQDGFEEPAMSAQDLANSNFSSASIKFTNTSPGGSFHVNPPPGYTPYADIYSKGIRASAADTSIGFTKGDIGMGRFYSESIDDNNQILHMRFGVPQYNSLLQFFSGFYNIDMGTAARSGRLTSNLIDKFLRFGANVISFVIAPLMIIPVGVMMFGTAARYFLNYPTSKFFTIKPSMELYWNAATQLLNQFAANMGLVNYFSSQQKSQVVGELNTPDYSLISEFIPDVYSANGTLDVYALANQAKRMQEKHEAVFRDMIDKSDGQDFAGLVKNYLGADISSIRRTATSNNGSTLESYLERFITTVPSLSSVTKDSNTELDWKTPKDADEGGQQTVSDAIKGGADYTPPLTKDSLISYALANLADGSDWVSFRVDYTSSVSESFTNQTAPSALAQKLNSMSSSARDISNTFSGSVLGSVVESVASVAKGIASNFNLDGLFSMGAFVDIPDHWDSSTSSINKSSYTMTLISPYGNPISQLFSIYLPLSLLLAGALPLATGKQSHTSPFLVEAHDKGRLITRTGIIDNLNITRGTSNLGFDKDGRAMAIEVSFTIKDLSSIVAMPIQPGFSLNLVAGLFDSENSFTDYLMALSAVDLRDSTYRIPMLKMQAKKTLAGLDTYFSSSHFAQYLSTMPGTSLLRGVMTGTLR